MKPRSRNIRRILLAYASLWALFVVGLGSVGAMQVLSEGFASLGAMVRAFGITMAVATIGFATLAAANIAVGRVRTIHKP